MTQRKDQGRYAKMVAFWGIVLLVAYGSFRGGGLVTVLDGWIAPEFNRTFIDPFPLLGSLKTSTLISIAFVTVIGIMLHKFLGTPKVATTLVDTEVEMHKVTWPTWPDTWNGTVAVGILVLILLLFLAGVDLVLIGIMRSFWGDTSGGAS